MSLALVLLQALAATTAAEADAVASLPGLATLPTAMFAGLLPTTPSADESSLFYWLCEANEDAHAKPLVLWLQGGPGASSLFSLFTETGPLRMNGELHDPPSVANVSWSLGKGSVNMLYIDQPLGTGFSAVTNESQYARSEGELAATVVAALRVFVERHPRYAHREFFLFGESFAGHMAPNVAASLSIAMPPVPLKLTGLAIGDGWVEPIAQNAAFVPYAKATGLIGERDAAWLTTRAEQCAVLLKAGRTVEAFKTACYYQLLNPIIDIAGGDVSPYDIRNYADTTDAPCDLDPLCTYLGREDVRTALHVPSSHPGWGTQSAGVEKALVADLNANTSLPLWPALLAAGVRVLVYNGNFDLICNALGTSNYLMKQWPALLEVNRTVWRSATTNITAGWKLQHPNLALTQVVVANAGHLAPKDQPENMRELALNFVTGATSLQPLED